MSRLFRMLRRAGRRAARPASLAAMAAIAFAAIAPAGPTAIAGTTTGDDYPRRGWRTQLEPTPLHSTTGEAIILDERTICIRHFNYTKAAPLVSFYLGAHDTHPDYSSGIQIGPIIGDFYEDATLVVQLEEGETIDDYNAIAVWCIAFNINFSSGEFAPPACVADIDGNGAVDVSDLLDVLAAWGPCICCDADIDLSGAVDVSDLLTVLADWGPCK